MNHLQAANSIRPIRSLWLRAVPLVLAALVLGACRGPQPTGGTAGVAPGHSPALSEAPAASYSPALPQHSTGPQAANYAPGAVVPVAAYADVPPGMAPPMPVVPNGVMGMGPAPMPFCGACPGPSESPRPVGVPPVLTGEYLCDGGDSGLRVEIAGQGQVLGLDTEDTVASFKTPDGRTMVEASNQVCIYSPRFASVRQVVGLQSNEQTDRTAGVFLPTVVGREAEIQRLRTNKQHIQPNRDVASRSLTIYRTKVGRNELSSSLGPRGFQSGFLPHEDFAIIRLGAFQEAEMARLAKGLNAAIAWTNRQAVRVILDEQRATEEVSDKHVGTVYGTGELPSYPRLRLVKVASTHFAEPGDTVDFTIRFDNVGNRPINSVTILDNLSPRLEYVEQSAQCSVAAHFGTETSETGTQVLRCEIDNPLPPGEGGILRFRCLVR